MCKDFSQNRQQSNSSVIPTVTPAALSFIKCKYTVLRQFSGMVHLSSIQIELEAGNSIWYITHAGHSIAFNTFLHFVPLWPWPLTFRPKINCWARTRGRLSLWQDWWLYSFSLFGFIVRTSRQKTESHTDTYERLTPATVGASNNGVSQLTVSLN